MTLLLEKGTTGRFIEIEHDSVVKRFLVPEISSLEGRIQHLIKKNPRLSLVRIGRAIVASKDEANVLKDGIEGIPSLVVGNYNVDLCGDHPHLGQGPARYSEQLVQAIAETEPEEVQQHFVAQGQSSIYDFSAKQEEAPTTPALPKADLAASLRAQMEQQKTQESLSLQEKFNQKVEEKKTEPVAAKSEIEVVRTPTAAHIQLVPVTDEEKMASYLENQFDVSEPKQQPNTQAQLNQAIEKSRQKREKERQATQIKTLGPRPQGKLDILIDKMNRIEDLLNNGLKSEITGPELEEWFYQHMDTIGHEKTFAILASRLKK